VPAILVPPQLAAQRTGNEIGDVEREPVHMHLRFQPAILLFPIVVLKAGRCGSA
jgi:hypothetical protein